MPVIAGRMRNVISYLQVIHRLVQSDGGKTGGLTLTPENEIAALWSPVSLCRERTLAGPRLAHGTTLCRTDVNNRRGRLLPPVITMNKRMTITAFKARLKHHIEQRPGGRCIFSVKSKSLSFHSTLPAPPTAGVRLVSSGCPSLS